MTLRVWSGPWVWSRAQVPAQWYNKQPVRFRQSDVYPFFQTGRGVVQGKSASDGT
jgi:hypothetical protein